VSQQLIANEDTPTATRYGWIRYERGTDVYAEIEYLDDFGGSSSIKKEFHTELDGSSPYDRAVHWIQSHFGEAGAAKPSKSQAPKL
jgi:hypothetical protein